MKQKTRFLSILALLLMAVTGAWAQVTYDEISPEGGESNAELNCTSFSISGTSNAGTGKNISPMTNKGFMVRKSNPLVMTINEGYRINAVTAYAAANDKLLPFQITKIEVDGVEYVPTGKTMPITCAQKNASEATAIEITGIAATDNITFTFGGTATLGIIELHVNYSIPAAEPEGPATFTATLAEGTEDADKWTITPNSGLNEGDQVTIQYNGTRRIKSVTAVVKEAAPAPEGAISGKFTINNSGDQVYFSKGNLQAKIATYASNTATASEWKFADNQYTYIGNAAGNTSFAAESWVDLFSWVGNSASNDTYGLITFEYPPSQANHGNVSGESLKTDWGTAAASNIGTGWRMLTKDEWLYLFGMEENETDKEGHARYRKYFRATVNSVQGIVVLPDNISGISDIPEESSRGTSSAFDGKTYTTEAWAALESAGCVFLPAAGLRSGASVSFAGSGGRYYSSTADGTNNAFLMYFNSGSVSPADSSFRNNGFSVRLVRPAE